MKHISKNPKVQKPIQAVILFPVLTILPAMAGIFLIPIYLKELSPKEYGILSLLNVLGSFYSTIAILQLNVAASISYFDYVQDQHKLKKYKSSLFSASFIIATSTFFLFTILGLLLFPYLTKTNEIPFVPLGMIVLLTQYLTQLKSIHFLFIKNEYRLLEFLTYSILLLVISIATQYYLIVVEKLGVLGSVSGQLMGNLIVTGIVLILQRKLFDAKPNIQYISSSLKLSIPFIPVTLMAWVFNAGDKILVERLTDLATVGSYAVLTSLLLLAENVFNSLINAFRPKIFESFNVLGKQEIENVGRLIRLYLLLALLVLSGVILIGSNLSLITQNLKYLSLVPLFTLGALTLIPRVVVRVYSLQLLYVKKTRLIAMITLISMAILILSLVLLVPVFGIAGALYSIGISNSIRFLMFYHYAKREFPILNGFTKYALYVILGFVSILGLAYLSYQTGLYAISTYGAIQFSAVAIYLVFIFLKNMHAYKHIKKQ
ncbi:MAG: oligosaccharide flippase family protein [Bacteroidota bacterium]